MTKGELRKLIQAAEVYKMSLGRGAALRAEALAKNALVFASDKDFYNAVVAADEVAISRTGKALRSQDYPNANAPDAAIAVWRRSIETISSLPRGTLVLHWEGGLDHLRWGISDESFVVDREQTNEFGQRDYVFHRRFLHGWRNTSIGKVPLSNIHPKARDLAINLATINRVQSHADYFRALILDQPSSDWESLPDWQAKAKEARWYPKPRTVLLAHRRAESITPQIEEAADYVISEVARMASTALHTAAYANGQTVLTVVKNKDIAFTKEELQDEIASLLEEQHQCCALTGYKFRSTATNIHLKMSLDRKDSSQGYVPGNLQVVTRAANFYKSASDEADWALKANALEHMAIAIQAKRKVNSPA
jgi:hypothetical protein